MPTVQPARFGAVTDYYMPGREQMEPGTNALVNGGNGAVDDRTVAQSGHAPEDGQFFGPDGMTFSDLLDVLNPLQHIPVIGEIYRAASGDEISAGARMAGGILYGGPLGFLGALANSIVAEATGKDIGGNVVALFSGDGDANGDGQLAAASPAHDNAAAADRNVLAATGDKADVAASAAAVALPAFPLAGRPKAPFASNPVQALHGGTVPRAALWASGQSAPALSPAAFHTLLNTFADTSSSPLPGAPGHQGGQGLAAGGETPPIHTGTIREAGLAINQLLRPHAKERD